MVDELWTFTSKTTLFLALNKGINEQNATSVESWGGGTAVGAVGWAEMPRSPVPRNRCSLPV